MPIMFGFTLWFGGKFDKRENDMENQAWLLLRTRKFCTKDSFLVFKHLKSIGSIRFSKENKMLNK